MRSALIAPVRIGGAHRVPREPAHELHAFIDGRRDPGWVASPDTISDIGKETGMNRDIVAGKWQQLRGKVKEQWGKLTDDDLTQAEGKFDKLSGVIRERYGYTRE